VDQPEADKPASATGQNAAHSASVANPSHDGLPPIARGIVIVSSMTAVMINSLDVTIANVALPHIQGSISASPEEITWVLTSYLVATAVTIPLTGWLVGKFGRKRVIVWSVAGFTATSVLCGLSGSLAAIVGFRFLQGAFGAALTPLSQLILLDLFPHERRGTATSLWSIGSIIGPILGPPLGGWLTDNLGWGWVFFINLPLGLLSFAGLMFFLPKGQAPSRTRLDVTGFVTLGIALAALQLMLDRGQDRDWFASREICIYATTALLAGYLFIAHTLTAEHSLLPRQLCRDRNFVCGNVLLFGMSLIIFAILALQPPMLETLMNYPVVLTGMVTTPRGITSLLSMIIAGRLVRFVNPRWLVALGFTLLAISLFNLTGVSLQMDERIVVSSSFIQGFGTGMVFMPLSMVTLSTVAPHLRADAAALTVVVRNVGSAIGISVLQTLTIRNTAVVHSRLVEGVRPDNPLMSTLAPGFNFNSPIAVAGMNARITRQASMVAFEDAFWLMLILCIAIIPLVLLLRTRPVFR
jgi:MFS transporter, DHA2 family, multidrug resistance protein